jgi:hypothetical protein
MLTVMREMISQVLGALRQMAKKPEPPPEGEGSRREEGAFHEAS